MKLNEPEKKEKAIAEMVNSYWSGNGYAGQGRRVKARSENTSIKFP